MVWLVPPICAVSVGPAVHVPGAAGVAGGVYRAVAPVAPTWNTRPSGSRIAGPISGTMPGQDCGSVTCVFPALTHWSEAMMYFSELGILEH
jgi:hypothetical protein